MKDLKQQQERSRDVGRVLEVTVRLGLVALLVAWVSQILHPFLSVIAWAAVIAVTLYPSFCRLTRASGGKASLVAVLFATLSVGLVVWSIAAIVSGSIEQTLHVATELRSGSLPIPEPNEKLNQIPLVGNKIYVLWSEAARDLETTLIKFADPLRELGDRALHGVLDVGKATAMFVFSLLVASGFMAHGETVAGFMHKLAERLLGKRGDEFVALATGTIRSVALGVLGVALIQATLAALGFAVMGIPFAGLWSVCVLFLAIVQLPTLLVIAPIVAYTFSTHDSTSATIFTLYLALVGLSDNVLKPLLLGRRAQVPTLVILMGSIGGMMFAGIIGLFIGPVVLAVFYRLFGAWLYGDTLNSENVGEIAPAAEGAAATV